MVTDVCHVSCRVAGEAEKRALMFSYGSGLAASLFSVKLKSGLKKIADTSNFQARLAQRKKVAPADFVEALKRYPPPHTPHHTTNDTTRHDTTRHDTR
jgi:3-hydroxy-3-methylglutaryl CoA synthase